MLTLTTGLRSVTGAHRATNQDALGCSDDYAFVADGVGGNAGGDVASWTVTHRAMATMATQRRPLGETRLRAVLADANAELGLRVAREPALTGMATTFTGVFCGARSVRVAHIGDSRAHLLRGGVLTRVTDDHSLVQMLVDAGHLTPQEAARHPQRNIITRSLSGRVIDAAGIDVRTVVAAPGDRWLLASDGLTDHVPHAELAALVRLGEPQDAADALVERALKLDARDNVSVAVCEVTEVLARPRPRPHRYAGSAATEELGVVGDLSR